MSNPLNFSWVIEGKLAGHGAITTPDDIEFIKKQGIKALVRMAGGEPATSIHRQLEDQGFADLHSPVINFSAPTQKQLEDMLNFIGNSISQGLPVSVSCVAGYGRAGTVLACYLVKQGLSADKAIETIRNLRPGSIETPEQELAIWNYFENFKK
jgi:atypical dual specificity phosphatase